MEAEEVAPDDGERLCRAAQDSTAVTVEALLASGWDVNTPDENGVTALQLACFNNEEETVRCLLDAGAAIEARNVLGGTALHVATFHADVRTVALLLDRGADVHARLEDGSLPQHVAAEQSKTDVVDMLLNHGVSIDATDGANGYTMLHVAAANGDVRTTALLVQRGADMEGTSKTGRTPLHLSALNGKPTTVEFLLSHGAAVGATDENGWTAMHAAAEFGDTGILHLLVQHGGDIHAATKTGVLPLHYAAVSGNLHAIDYFIGRGADIDAADNAGWTPLHHAAAKADVRTVALLVERGADVHATSKARELPIHRAASNGRSESVAFLLDHGTEIEATDELGWTALHSACYGGDVRTMNLLVERGADVHRVTKDGKTTLYLSAGQAKLEAVEYLLNQDVSVVDINGWSALHAAAESGDVRTMTLLMERGADVHAASKTCVQPIHRSALNRRTEAVVLLMDYGADIEATDADGWTSLHFASYGGDVRTMNLLVERGADVHRVAKDGKTTLYLSAGQAKLEAVQYLLARDVSVKVVDNDGWSALHAAAEGGDVRIMALLVEHGADVNANSEAHELPIHRAALNGRSEVVAFLLDHDTEYEAMDEDGWTALHSASYGGDIRTMTLLVERGVDVHKVTTDGRTALYLSAEQAKLEAVQYLLDHDVSIQVANNDGWSALHAAAENGDVCTMAFLVERGADVQATSKTGELPVHIAALQGKVEAVKFLLDRGATATVTSDDGSSALHLAARFGDVRTMTLLIENGADVHSVSKIGTTTLHESASKGHTNAVEFLIDRGVALERADGLGFRALHHAGDGGHVATMAQLVKHGANVHAVAEDGSNLVHQAAFRGDVDVLAYALDLGLDVNAIADNYGNWETALMLAIWYPNVEVACEMVFILCSRGAEWNDEHHRQALRLCQMYDDADDARSAERQTRRQWRAGLCVCVHHWALEQFQTKVPSEVVARGAASVTTYLADITQSGTAGLTYRCKSCVVGPSEWGKTSLVRSLVARKSSLTQLKDRTIGIDLVACIFGEDDDASSSSASTRQEITFWDFAGQTVYHVAHSPFFSRRTLYLVAVDLEAYSTQLRHIQTKSTKDQESAMNRFVTSCIWRWLGMIITHHPDAQFVFIGTKADRVKSKNAIQDVREDLQDRFDMWERSHRDHDHLGRFGGGLDTTRASLRSFNWLVMNSQVPASITAACQTLQQAITSHEIGFPMGTTYFQVLRSVKARRKDARSAETGLARIERSIVLFTTLRRELLRDIGGLERDDCEQILRTLNDLGDILWYEHADAGVLKDFIILDPMLVLDAVREVIRHDFTEQKGGEWPQDGRITHAQLSQFALWKDMDKELMHAFKKLLQHFQLAYPADDDVMQPESDLIVPTYWKVKADRSKSSRTLLQTQKSVCDDFVKYRWCWEYELPNELAEIVFDQLAVQSHAAQLKRRIQDLCIEAKCDEFATSIRLMQQNASMDIIRIEVSGTTMDRSWHTMRFYLMKMEKVLDGYKRVDVGRYIVHRPRLTSNDEVRHPLGPAARALKDAISLGESESSVRASTMPWMPPDMMWYLDKSWRKDIRQFQQLQMASMIESKLEVLRKLAIAGSAPRMPALWSLQLVEEEQKVVLRVLSDLSGLCFHTPIEIDTGSPVVVKYGRYFKVGISLVSTVASEALSISLIKMAIDAAKTGLSQQLDYAQRIHSLFEQLDIAASERSSTEFESRTATNLPPDAATRVLHDLLTVYNDSSDALNVSELTNLECVVTSEGEYVWAHEHEIAMLGDKVTRRGMPPSVWADLPEPSPAPSSPTAQSSTASPSSPSSTTKKSSSSSFKLSLCVDSVVGLADWDWFKTYCKWQLFYGKKSGTPIASGATLQNADSSASPSWGSVNTNVNGATSYEMLLECRLVVQVKRRSRIGWTKSIGEGQVFLRDVLPAAAKDTLHFDAFQVPLDGTTPSMRSVKIQLASHK